MAAPPFCAACGLPVAGPRPRKFNPDHYAKDIAAHAGTHLHEACRMQLVKASTAAAEAAQAAAAQRAAQARHTTRSVTLEVQESQPRQPRR